MAKKYTLSYVPSFVEDLTAARGYITNCLKNPEAAMRLMDDVERAILKRLDNPEGYARCYTVKNHEHVYYRINVRSYAIFYVVIDDVMEVRHFIYGRRNIPNLL